MNIFVLDTDIDACARMHCDRHVIKMILESAQMLSTVVSEHGGRAKYKPTHRHHPCTRWAGQTRANFRWLTDLALALAFEHEVRFNPKREHASCEVVRACFAQRALIPAGPLTPFVQAMPERYRGPDAVAAYRRYYRAEKAAFATWQAPRREPAWWRPVALHNPSGT